MVLLNINGLKVRQNRLVVESILPFAKEKKVEPENLPHTEEVTGTMRWRRERMRIA